MSKNVHGNRTVTNNEYNELKEVGAHTGYFSETHEEAHKNEENST